ncbi:MAG TPA: DUF3467 domain-containing protein [Clostridia bacterium]|nr:DUF3467 domain-containing protein [Clostridia bacterium]
MNTDTNINVIIPEGIGDPKYSNSFRTSFNETDFQIDFGHQVAGEDTLNVVSRITIPTSVMKKFVVTLFMTAQSYEKQFEQDLGFGGIKK